MERLSPVSLALYLMFGFVSIASFYYLLLHPLKHIPGPFLARFTELWRSHRYFNGHWHEDILNLHKTYGAVVRIAPNEVSVVHPDLIKTAFGHGSAGTAKAPWYRTWVALGGTSGKNSPPSFFGEEDPKIHGFMRKRVSHLYSMSSVVAAEDNIQGVLSSLWQKFDHFAEVGENVNLSKWAYYFTYDVVGTVCWSAPLGMIREEKDVDNYIRLMHEAFYWISNLGYLPGGSSWITNPLTAHIAPLFGSSIHLSAKPFQKQCFKKVMARRKEGSSKDKQARDMLDHFLGMKNMDGTPLGLAEIMPEVGNPMAAGADTTSIGIRAVLGPILLSKKHYERLQNELDQARKDASLNKDEMLPFKTLKYLPFLSACIKEGGRIHPSIVYNLPRKVPKGGITIDGRFMPQGSTISFSPLAQNRCQSIFGEDADEWRPERWIEGEGSSEEDIKRMDKYIATFGYGSRMCVGRNLATYEIYKFISQLLGRYDVELLNRDQPWTVRSSWIAELENMTISLKRRLPRNGLL